MYVGIFSSTACFRAPPAVRFGLSALKNVAIDSPCAPILTSHLNLGGTKHQLCFPTGYKDKSSLHSTASDGSHSCTVHDLCCFRPYGVRLNRYTHEISFVGRAVIGNVQQLTAAECTSIEVSGGGTAALTPATANEGEALGTATTVQSVTVRRTRLGVRCWWPDYNPGEECGRRWMSCSACKP